MSKFQKKIIPLYKVLTVSFFFWRGRGRISHWTEGCRYRTAGFESFAYFFYTTIMTMYLLVSNLLFIFHHEDRGHDTIWYNHMYLHIHLHWYIIQMAGTYILFVTPFINCRTKTPIFSFQKVQFFQEATGASPVEHFPDKHELILGFEFWWFNMFMVIFNRKTNSCWVPPF